MGRAIEDFEVERNPIGKGGCGYVYRAKEIKTGYEYAIKVIEKQLMRDKHMQQRVQEEIRLQKKLIHPSILKLYDWFTDRKHYYLILELCHGGDLKSYLEQNRTGVKEDLAQYVMKQITDGLLFLHEQDIMHRDIKLGNLLLTTNLQVKIADFGLATKLKRPDEKHMTMCGTANYIAPEVAKRSSHGLECDVYSLGVVLYSLLTGRPPSSGKENSRVNENRLSKEAKDLIKRMLHNDPSERIELRDVLLHPFMIKDFDNCSIKKQSTNSSYTDSGMDTMSTGASLRTASSRSHSNRLPTLNEQTSIISETTTSAKTQSSRQRGRFEKSLGSNFNPLPTKDMRKFHNKMDEIKVNSTCNCAKSRSHCECCVEDKDEKSCCFEIVKKCQNVTSCCSHVEQCCVTTSCSHVDMCGCRVRGREEERNRRKEECKRDEIRLPFNTTRLKERRERYGESILTIVASGDVCVEFLKEVGTSTKVVFVFMVSADGKVISLYNLTEEQRYTLRDYLQIPDNCRRRRFTLEKLPEKYHWRYDLVSRMIVSLRSRTTKLTVYIPEAKCYLMENGDFEVKFDNGALVTKNAKGTRITQPTDNFNNLGETDKKLLEYFNKSHEFCVHFEGTFTTSEQMLNRKLFPCVLNLRQPKTPNGTSTPKPRLKNDSSNNAALHDMRSTTPDSLFDNPLPIIRRNRSRTTSPSIRKTDVRTPSPVSRTTDARSPTSSVKQRGARSLSPASTGKSVIPTITRLGRDEYEIESKGNLFILPGSQLLMKYLDGSQVLMSYLSTLAAVYVTDPNGVTECYRSHEKLPEIAHMVKELLEYVGVIKNR